MHEFLNTTFKVMTNIHAKKIASAAPGTNFFIELKVQVTNE